MQWTPHLVTHDQALDERPAVVSATRSHGEELIALARNDHIVLTDLPLKHSAIGDLADRNSIGEIQPCRALHICLLMKRS
jgi:hypothetical protein